MKKHYQTLGLEEGASQEAIKAAYTKLSKEINPVNNNNQEFFKEEYEKVQESYKALYNSSILATEQGAKSAGNESVGLKESNSNKKKTPVPKKRIAKRDFAFGGLLFFIATGIWGVFLQNMGFFAPSYDYIQKVGVIKEQIAKDKRLSQVRARKDAYETLTNAEKFSLAGISKTKRKKFLDNLAKSLEE